MPESDRTVQLLVEIRNLLADRDKRYDEYLEKSTKRQEDAQKAWADKVRFWSFVFWCGSFFAVFLGTLLALRLAN
jgi:hypothetical protein